MADNSNYTIFAYYKTLNDFTGADTDDIIVKTIERSMNVYNQPVYLTYYTNITQGTHIKSNDIDYDNLVYLMDTTSSIVDIDNSLVLNQISSGINTIHVDIMNTSSQLGQISSSLNNLPLISSGINVLKTSLEYLSLISSGINSNNTSLAQVSNGISAVHTLVSSSLSTLNSLNVSANTTLSNISSSLSTLNLAFTAENVTAQSITNGNNATFSNVRYMVVSGVSLLGLGNIVINGVSFPCTTSGNTYILRANNKFNTNIVIAASGCTVSVLYTTG